MAVPFGEEQALAGGMRRSVGPRFVPGNFANFVRSALGTLDVPMAARDSGAVLRKLGHVLLIVALLSASGTHWLVLQSVAWTTMLASNLRTSSLGEALERTFDGRHPCRLCRQIAKDR